MSSRLAMVASFILSSFAHAAPIPNIVSVYQESGAPVNAVINDAGQITYIHAENLGNEANRYTPVFRDGNSVIYGEQVTASKILGSLAGSVFYGPSINDNGTLMYARRTEPGNNGAVVKTGQPGGPFSQTNFGGSGRVYFSGQSFNDAGQIAFTQGSNIKVSTGSLVETIAANAFNAIGPSINDLGSVAWGSTSGAIYLDVAGGAPAVNIAAGVTPEIGSSFSFSLNNDDVVAFAGADRRVYIASATSAPLAITSAFSEPISAISINDHGNVAFTTNGALYFAMAGQSPVKILGINDSVQGYNVTGAVITSNSLNNNNDVVFGLSAHEVAIVHVPELGALSMSLLGSILCGWVARPYSFHSRKSIT